MLLYDTSKIRGFDHSLLFTFFWRCPPIVIIIIIILSKALTIIIITKPSTHEKCTGGGGGCALRCRPAATRELFICNGFDDDGLDDDAADANYTYMLI